MDGARGIGTLGAKGAMDPLLYSFLNTCCKLLCQSFLFVLQYQLNNVPSESMVQWWLTNVIFLNFLDS